MGATPAVSQEEDPSARFDGFLFSANFDFTHSQLLLEQQQHRVGTRFCPILRTMAHEQFHVFQLLASTYGYYYQLLLELETALIMDVARQLVAKTPSELKAPLLRLVETKQYKDFRSPVHQVLGYAHNAEVLRLFLQGDHQAYLNLERGPFGPQSFSSRFTANENMLVRFLQQTGRGFPLEGFQVPSASDRPKEDAAFALKVLLGVDVNYILEGSAAISEYWHYDRPSLTIRAPINWEKELTDLNISQRHHPKYWMLPQTFRESAAPDLSCDEFVGTFLAICDLALNPPILPFHAPFRRPEWTVYDLCPSARVHRLISRGGELTPIRNLPEDYKGYVAALAKAEQMPTPWEMAEGSIRLKLPAADPAMNAFREAQAFRAKIPWVFLGFEMLGGEPDGEPLHPIVKGFQSVFAHMIIAFQDRVLYHTNKEDLNYFRLRYALSRYARQLLLSTKDRIEIRFPCPMSKELIRGIEHLMREVLGGIWRKGPPVQIEGTNSR